MPIYFPYRKMGAFPFFGSSNLTVVIKIQIVNTTPNHQNEEESTLSNDLDKNHSIPNDEAIQAYEKI